MDNKSRGEKIRFQILKDVKDHPTDISKHIANKFSITLQAVNNHLKRLENEGWLKTTGKGKGKKYFLGEVRACSKSFSIKTETSEDEIWRNHFLFIFEGLPQNLVDICHYGFTEILNNVIDHSDGEHVFIDVERDKESIRISILDDGEGIFRKIKRLCNLCDERQALLELSKGKLTTDPDRHTGEGIFFTSRVFDVFEIHSYGLNFSHDNLVEHDFMLETEISENKPGTLVYMFLKRESKRDIQSVFDDYAGPDAYEFNKTVIPVRLAKYGDEKLVSRSQAKRLLTRIERFKYVVFDFQGVSFIGRAFADEIFRVYARQHPGIKLSPINMEENVEKMVRQISLNRCL